jgi:hypothetical protein
MSNERAEALAVAARRELAQPVTDEVFLAAVEGAAWPGEQFKHREHLRLAWLYLRRHGQEAGTARIRETILRYATALGAAGIYHETLTRAWGACVGGALRETPGLEPFDAFLAAHPELLERTLLERYYRRETLESEEARRGWVPPDVAALP